MTRRRLARPDKERGQGPKDENQLHKQRTMDTTGNRISDRETTGTSISGGEIKIRCGALL